jgi:hypothetical protein
MTYGQSTTDSGHFHEVLGRALTNEEYRAQITSDDVDKRKAALRDVTGEEPSEELLKALDDAIVSLRSFSKAFGIEAAVT